MYDYLPMFHFSLVSSIRSLYNEISLVILVYKLIFSNSWGQAIFSDVRKLNRSREGYFPYVRKLFFFQFLGAEDFFDVRKLICWTQGAQSHFFVSPLTHLLGVGGPVTCFHMSINTCFSNSLALGIFRTSVNSFAGHGGGASHFVYVHKLIKLICWPRGSPSHFCIRL